MKDNQTYREDEGSPSDQYTNGQTKQPSTDLSPADGGNGFVGSNTGSQVGMKMVEGQKGYTTDRPIWNTQSSFMGVKDNTGSQDGDESFGGQDPTDEYASYKKIQTDEGLPQTYRTAKGAGDAGMTGSDEPDKNGTFGKMADGGAILQNQKIGSEMPKTEFTDSEGGGAPLWKR